MNSPHTAAGWFCSIVIFAMADISQGLRERVIALSQHTDKTHREIGEAVGSLQGSLTTTRRQTQLYAKDFVAGKESYQNETRKPLSEKARKTRVPVLTLFNQLLGGMQLTFH